MTAISTMFLCWLFSNDRKDTARYFKETWIYHLVMVLLALPMEILVIIGICRHLKG